MEVFFIRHGETAGNRAFAHQAPDTPLTDKGRKQAHAAGVRLKSLEPTRIIASPMTRAKETAQIIGAELELPVTTHESFVELKRPSYLNGHKHYGFTSLWYILRWFLRYNDPHWRSIGGESYGQFIERIGDAKEYLESYEEHERIVVVSHSIFINFFVEHICHERRMSFFEAFLRLTKIFALDNSSITHVEYHFSDAQHLCTWHVKRFDDDAHVTT